MEEKELTKALTAVRSIEKYDRYLAAFVFGSNDPFIKVIVDKRNCENLNHPFPGYHRLGISFVSFDQFEEALKGQRKKDRRQPMVNDAIVLFDKTGRLQELIAAYKSEESPERVMKEDHQMIRFTVFHADGKIGYALAKGDELSAQFGMHVSINDLLKVHYRINSKWFVNDKLMLADLRSWDTRLSQLLATFLNEAATLKKYEIWQEMTRYVLQPIGNTGSLAENNCTCKACREDLARLLTEPHA